MTATAVKKISVHAKNLESAYALIADMYFNTDAIDSTKDIMEIDVCNVKADMNGNETDCDCGSMHTDFDCEDCSHACSICGACMYAEDEEC